MIYLAQTDTTAGFLSDDKIQLNRLKNRPDNQECIITTSKFQNLLKLTRIPNIHKNCIRKSKFSTFLYPNSKAIRVIKDHKHAKFLSNFDWLYSTSANLHGKNFDLKWALQVADIAVDSHFSEEKSSKIFKISNSNIKRLR